MNIELNEQEIKAIVLAHINKVHNTSFDAITFESNYSGLKCATLFTAERKLDPMESIQREIGTLTEVSDTKFAVGGE